MSKDYYELLGIDRDASPEQIKKAYRKLAGQLHPDRNKGDESSKVKFQEVNQAYSVLSDPSKRSVYDKYGEEGVKQSGQAGPGQQGPNSGGFDGFGDFSDIFSEFFGQGFGGGTAQRAHKGDNLQYRVSLTLAEVYCGTHRDIIYQRACRCSTCKGSKAKPGSKPVKCRTCGGSGMVTRGSMGFMQIRQTCTACRGAGQVMSDPCAACKGVGLVSKREELKVKIQPGVTEETPLRVPGKGEEVPGVSSIPGDLYLFFEIQNDPRYRRDGYDLHTEYSLYAWDMVLGKKVSIVTPDDKSINLQVSACTQPGKILRINGKGIKRQDSGKDGNLYVHVHAKLPSSVNAAQKKLFEQIKKSFEK